MRENFTIYQPAERVKILFSSFTFFSHCYGNGVRGGETDDLTCTIEAITPRMRESHVYVRISLCRLLLRNILPSSPCRILFC